MKMNFVISVRGFSVSIGYHVCNVRLQLTFTLDPLRCTLSEPRVLASYPAAGHVEECHGSASILHMLRIRLAWLLWIIRYLHNASKCGASTNTEVAVNASNYIHLLLSWNNCRE